MPLDKLEARDRADHLALLGKRLQEECGGDVLELAQRAFEFGVAFATNTGNGRRTCRICGCWELAACDGGCWWVAEDLCSSCGEEPA